MITNEDYPAVRLLDWKCQRGLLRARSDSHLKNTKIVQFVLPVKDRHLSPKDSGNNRFLRGVRKDKLSQYAP